MAASDRAIVLVGDLLHWDWAFHKAGPGAQPADLPLHERSQAKAKLLAYLAALEAVAKAARAFRQARMDFLEAFRCEENPWPRMEAQDDSLGDLDQAVSALDALTAAQAGEGTK